MTREPVTIAQVDSVDKMMERLNELHEAGEIRSLMIIYFDPAGFIGNYWSRLPSTSRAVGALEMCKHELLTYGG